MSEALSAAPPDSSSPKSSPMELLISAVQELSMARDLGTVMAIVRRAELIAALRKIDPGICVVVMSGYAHDRGEIMQDLQVAGWLDKPVKIEGLVQTLREALSRRVP